MRSALFVLALLLSQSISAQQITRIYIAPAANPELARARKDLQSELRKIKSVEIVSSAADADATLTADGEIYVKGYYSLNPRSGIAASHGSPVYGGYLSVRVKGASGDVLWSYFVDTPRSNDPARELSKKIVKHFAETFRKT
jgi:hypothetical protein